MSRGKVLLSAYACSPTRGSEEGNGWSWAIGLAKEGFEVWCFTSVAYENEINEACRRLNNPNLHFVFVHLSHYADNHFLNPDSKMIYLHYYLWRRKAAKIAAQMHASIKFDVGHHVTYGSLQQGHFLWKLKNIRIIFGPVGGGQRAPDVLKEYFESSWKFERLRNYISKWMVSFSRNFRNSLAKADCLLVTNADTLEMALKSGYISRDKVFFFPDHAVPVSMEDVPQIVHAKSQTFHLLWVGRILPRKGLNLVLDAISRLPASFNYDLTIVGGGGFAPRLSGWIKKYALDAKKIKVVGHVPFSRVKQYYEQSDVFIFCTLRDSFPMQITEALAFGLPVITLDLHGSAQALPDNCGIKIPVKSKEEILSGITSAVIKLQTDDGLRERCSDNAYRHIKQHLWRNHIETVVREHY